MQQVAMKFVQWDVPELEKLKDYAGTKRKFEHGLWDVDAQMHVSRYFFRT